MNNSINILRKYINAKNGIMVDASQYDGDELRQLSRLSVREKVPVIVTNTDTQTLDQIRQLLRSGAGIRLTASIWHMDQLHQLCGLSGSFGGIVIITNAAQLSQTQCKILTKRSPGKIIFEL